MGIRHRANLSAKHNNHVHRWTVSYADYMTLMFALFVVLYAVSLNKEEKYQEIISAIQNASQFVHSNRSDLITEGILTTRNNSIQEGIGPQLLNDEDNGQLGHASELYHQQLPSEKLSNINAYQTGEPLINLQLSLQLALKNELKAEGVSVDLNGDWLTIEMRGPLSFSQESHTLLNHAKQKIRAIAEVLTPVNNMIRLRGYTDTTPISNEIYQSNWELSAMRSMSVLHALNELGVIGGRMAIEGFGKFQPVFDKAGLVDPFSSRRVVIAISKFALMANDHTNADNKEMADKEQLNNNNVDEKEDKAKPDSDDIQELYLPNGRLIITTRQE